MSSYYKKVYCLMLCISTRDQSSDTKIKLSLLESAMLNIIIKACVKGLTDEDVKRDTI